MAIAPPGNMFYTDNGSDNSVYDLTQGSGSFGAVAVGSTTTAAVNVTFNASETPATTSVAPSSTIKSGAGSTCTAGTTYAPGSTCIVIAQFAPAAPGVPVAGITLAGSQRNCHGNGRP